MNGKEDRAPMAQGDDGLVIGKFPEGPETLETSNFLFKHMQSLKAMKTVKKRPEMKKPAGAPEPLKKRPAAPLEDSDADEEEEEETQEDEDLEEESAEEEEIFEPDPIVEPEEAEPAPPFPMGSKKQDHAFAGACMLAPAQLCMCMLEGMRHLWE